jgi:flagellar hook-length control protein FliK
MSQFAMMLPIQGSGSGQKTPTNSPLQAAEGPDLEGLSFNQTLENLTETNPNAAALLLALQQMGLLSETPVNLQMSGSQLPVVGESGGNGLPQSTLQATQTQTLQSLTFESAVKLSTDQLLPEQAGRLPLMTSAQGLERLPLTSADGLQIVDSRGGFDLNLNGLGGLGSQSASSSLGIRSAISLPVQIPVGQTGWDSAVGDKIQWMVSRQVQSAEIKLTPPNLGPMEIKLSIQNDQTSVQFVASHAATREALEAAIPRLREMFGEIQLNLANVDVSQQQANGSQAGNDSGSGSTEGYDDANGGSETGRSSAESLATQQGSGLLDTYA